MIQERRVQIDELFEHYVMKYPMIAEVWCDVMEMAQEYEDDRGMGRQELCQALVITALELIVKREDLPQLSRPDSVRRFHRWCERYLGLVTSAYTTKEEQMSYERLFGHNDHWLFDGRNFGHGGGLKKH